MIFKHFTKILPSLKPEDIIPTKFQKPSLIDEAGKAFRTNNKEKIKQYNNIKLNFQILFNRIKK